MTTNAAKQVPSPASEQGGDDLASARQVLEIEAQALRDLAAGLGAEFVSALDIISKIEGRVVVSGMGKSGHIGNKIVATLASTGTPSFFVHPGEASHGDLGMITRADAVLALSNSGETSELSDLVAYCKRFGIPLIGVTSRAESTLGRAATVPLVLPNSPEAGTLGLAPTTSTTLMLGLGDAMAVALLERKGFSSTDFKTFHPGGKLGLRLLKVQELMHSGDELPVAPGHINMSEALLLITQKRFGCLAIVDDDGAVEGIITDGDLRRHMGPDFLTLKAKDVMTTNAQTVGPDTLASEVVALMNAKSITNIFVVESGRAVGIVHIHDCLRAGVV